MRLNAVLRFVLMGIVISGLSGCALLRFGGNPPDPDLTRSTATEAERTEKLRETIDRSLREAQRADSPETAELLYRHPYYYREYVKYPDGIEEYGLEAVASDSRVAPYTANIRLAKERYTTRFDKKKNRVPQNANYYRTKGYETRSYELRHGRWRELGTFFVAEETDETLRRNAPEFDPVVLGGVDAEKKGFFGRLFFWRD